MAILIQMNKTTEFDDLIVYEFGPVEEIIGSVALDKHSGEMVLLEIKRPDSEWFYVPRVRSVLARCREQGEYPERTDYRA
jgi:hypothetical protein